jgi:hypothetical protein
MSFDKLKEDIVNLVLDETTKEIEDKAKAIVVGEYISEFPDHMSAVEAYDYIMEAAEKAYIPDDILVWQPHEYLPCYDLGVNMESLKTAIMETFTATKGG